MEQSKWKTLEKIFILLRFDIQNLNASHTTNTSVDCLNNATNTDCLNDVTNVYVDCLNKIAEAVIQSLNNNLSNSVLYHTICTIIPKWQSQFPPAAEHTKNIKITENLKTTEISKTTKATNSNFSCPKEIESFIITALQFMQTNLSSHNYDIALDIADLLQGLYGVVLSNSKKSLKQYQKTYLKPFQKKWHLNIFNDFKSTFHSKQN